MNEAVTIVMKPCKLNALQTRICGGTLHVLFLLMVIASSADLKGQPLSQLAAAQGKYLGVVINTDFLQGNDANNVINYNDVIDTEFNCTVAENAMKMRPLIRNRPVDPFDLQTSDFTPWGIKWMDAMTSYASDHEKRLRGHALIWYNQAPQWLIDESPTWTDQQVYDFAEEYITTMLEYTNGKVQEWDVVNEAISDIGGFRTQETWYSGVSDIQDFIDHCFKVAHQADSTVLLFYNDYSIESSLLNSEKHQFMKDMVSDMIDRGIPIDGVGLQAHFESGSYGHVNDNVIQDVGLTMDFIGNLGLIANMTELDLRLCDGNDETELAIQKDHYKKFTQLFLERDFSQSLLIWGVSDADSWVPGQFTSCDHAVLYDHSGDKKPAYWGVHEALSQSSAVGIVDRLDNTKNLIASPVGNSISLDVLANNETWIISNSQGQVIAQGKHKNIECSHLQSGWYTLKSGLLVAPFFKH